jgi:DNA polymerase (family X)
MTNREVAELLSQFADLLDIKGESSFRVSAYRRGADTIKRLEEPVVTLVEQNRLTDIKGIGKGLAGNVSDIIDNGHFPDLEKLQDEVPATLLTVLAIPGIGPKSVGRFYRELGITNLEQLEQTVESGAISELKGFGKKQEQKITEGIAFLRQRTGRVSIGTSLPAARNISQALAESLGTRAEIAGSVRRRAETIGNIDILVETDSPEAVKQVLETALRAEDLSLADDSVITCFVPGLCDLRVLLTSSERWGSDLLELTGSKEHVASFFMDGSVDSEEIAYGRHDLPWIEPELRENRGELEAARINSLPRIIQLADIRGDLHLHSNWSDGRATIEQLAARATELGYQYLCIADHSHSLAIARGLNADRLREQANEIARVQQDFPQLQLLRANEVEVRRDGSLDFEDEVLEDLDLVVASLHSGRNMSERELTDRLLMAIENPHVDIIAHPTGRIVEQRPAAAYDWERVFDAAARTGTALEINANPARLDLPEELARKAVEQGVFISIDSDAHDLAGLDVMEYGVGIARRAWIEARSVVNTWDVDALLTWLRR